jgi:hypothetical protein
MIGCLLDHDVTRLDVNHRIVEHHVDFAGQNDGIVDGPRAVHERMPDRKSPGRRAIVVRKLLAPLTLRSDVPQDARDAIAEAIQGTPLSTDVWIYRAVVVILGVTVLGTVFGGLALVAVGHADPNMKLPDSIVAIGSAAVGALAGLLAPSPVTRGG